MASREIKTGLGKGWRRSRKGVSYHARKGVDARPERYQTENTAMM